VAEPEPVAASFVDAQPLATAEVPARHQTAPRRVQPAAKTRVPDQLPCRHSNLSQTHPVRRRHLSRDHCHFQMPGVHPVEQYLVEPGSFRTVTLWPEVTQLPRFALHHRNSPPHSARKDPRRTCSQNLFLSSRHSMTTDRSLVTVHPEAAAAEPGNLRPVPAQIGCPMKKFRPVDDPGCCRSRHDSPTRLLCGPL
jgi:hypothetical protein